jgi:hypothetical protein
MERDSETAVDRPASLTEALSHDVPMDLGHARELFRSEQSLPMALLAGGGAALVGAIGWAVVTAVTHFQIGFMAVGVGLLSRRPSAGSGRDSTRSSASPARSCPWRAAPSATCSPSARWEPPPTACPSSRSWGR